MGSLSNYTEQAYLAWVKGTNMPAAPTAYLALFNGDPGEAGSGGTEVTTTIRVAGRVAVSFAAASGRAMSSDTDTDFGAAAGAATVDNWALFDAASGGNMLAYGAFTSSNSVGAGENFSVASGNITITASSGALPNTYAHMILDWIGGVTAATAPAATYMALFNGDPQGAGSEVTTTIDATGRKAVTFTGTTSLSNSTLVDYGAADSGATVDYGAVYDASSAGNLLLSGALGSSVSVSTGDEVTFPIGNITITLD